MGLQQPFVEQWNEGNLTKVIAEVVMPASYGAGGLAILASELGQAKILGAKILGVNTAGIGANWVWNQQTGKMMCILPTGGADTSPSTLAAPAIADSGSGGDSDTFAITPGIGKEIAATADLSGVTLTVEFACIA